MHSVFCGAGESVSVDQGRVEVPEYPTPVRVSIIRLLSLENWRTYCNFASHRGESDESGNLKPS